MDSFLHMGGYAFYVWTSYALALVVLSLNWILPRRALHKRWHALLRREQSSTGKAA
ncbi:MAG: heme exporter protein CcmD [Gammaproteobacteria bacterium]|nr:heme exporter protein CcmD [Gammaproteobacteria bacterium]